MNKKTIWITGGSTGIGKALAIKFANKGWNVAISARRENLLEEISNNNENIHGFPLDVTDKSNPVLIANATYSNDSYTHQGWLTEDLKYFILGDETDELNFGFNTKTIVFDFSDLDNPQFDFDYFGTTPAIDHNGYTKNNKYLNLLPLVLERVE